LRLSIKLTTKTSNISLVIVLFTEQDWITTRCIPWTN